MRVPAMGHFCGPFFETVACALSAVVRKHVIPCVYCALTSAQLTVQRPNRFLMAVGRSSQGAASYFQPSGRMSDGRKYGMKEAARAMPNQPPGTLFTAAMKPVLTWGQS